MIDFQLLFVFTIPNFGSSGPAVIPSVNSGGNSRLHDFALPETIYAFIDPTHFSIAVSFTRSDFSITVSVVVDSLQSAGRVHN